MLALIVALSATSVPTASASQGNCRVYQLDTVIAHLETATFSASICYALDRGKKWYRGINKTTGQTEGNYVMWEDPQVGDPSRIDYTAAVSGRLRVFQQDRGIAILRDDRTLLSFEPAL